MVRLGIVCYCAVEIENIIPCIFDTVTNGTGPGRFVFAAVVMTLVGGFGWAKKRESGKSF